MTADYLTIIRSASHPLAPIPTGLAPRLTPLRGIRAVLFDIYGTLVISGSGDVGTTNLSAREEAFAAALTVAGWQYQPKQEGGAELLRQTIVRYHEQMNAEGNATPEIDIREIWQETCLALEQRGSIAAKPNDPDYARLAVEFEVRVNPVWPMPGLVEILRQIRQAGQVMGIISNAQFFTPLVMEALTGKTVDELGFAQDLRYYSYRHQLAKPGRELYQRATAKLAEHGLEPPEVLYVGNDMRNDIRPAAAVGFRTGLFAGDQRSLRLREDDPETINSPAPEAILTRLDQIANIIGV